MILDSIKYDSIITTDKGKLSADVVFQQSSSIKCLTYEDNQFKFKKIVEMYQFPNQKMINYYFQENNEESFISSSESLEVYSQDFNIISIKNLIPNKRIKNINYNVKYSLELFSSYEKLINAISFLRLGELEFATSFFIKIENDLPIVVNNFLVHLSKRDTLIET